VKVLYCPSNRVTGGIKLGEVGSQWGMGLPPYAAGTDYAFCHGANAGLPRDWRKTPLPVRGVFGVFSSSGAHAGVSLVQIANGNGAGNTIALGDAAGGTTTFRVRDLGDPNKPAIDVTTGQDALIDQSWSAGGVADPGHPWYGSVFAVTAQYGFPSDPRDEPMNRPLVTPTINGGDRGGDNRSGQNYVSGFRSQHTGGCNFLFCDGSARFVTSDISPVIYRGLSTYAGGERAGGLME
jgi:prepilin-type processing-associated H-X9-DG protein